MFYIAEKNADLCLECDYCEKFTPCMGFGPCSGCGVCYLLCPYDAVKLKQKENFREIGIKVDGEKFYVPENITVKKALEFLGFKFQSLRGIDEEFLCCTGGCWNCIVMINEELKRGCITRVEENMEIRLTFNYEPLRSIQKISKVEETPLTITPKGIAYSQPEVVCIVCGCNFRCPQCFNWLAVYNSRGVPLTAKETAKALTSQAVFWGAKQIAITGGEPTLNKKWLLNLVREIKSLSETIKVHVDTNGSLLTSEYLDELTYSGMDAITIDIKAARLETFMKITGLVNKGLAERFFNRAWKAVKHTLDVGRVDVVVGLPYNEELISFEEFQEVGCKLRMLSEDIKVTIIPYMPAFRRRNMAKPSIEKLKKAYSILKDEGLKNVVCQVGVGI